MKKTSKIQTVTFESVSESLADSQKVSSFDSHQVGNGRFHGTETFEDAVALATNGWHEGAARINKLRTQLTHFVEKAVAAKTKSVAWDVTGDYLDVGRYLSGEPEVFGEYKSDDGSVAGKVVKIVANVSAIGSVESESIFSAGAAIYAAVDLLESLGHRVELWLGSGSKANGYGGAGTAKAGKRLQVLVKLKDAGQPVDSDRLAFYLAHNASLRRLFFSSETQRGFAPSSSSTTPLELEAGAIVTPEVRPQDTTQERRIQRVLEVCKSVGVEFSAEELAEITS